MPGIHTGRIALSFYQPDRNRTYIPRKYLEYLSWSSTSSTFRGSTCRCPLVFAMRTGHFTLPRSCYRGGYPAAYAADVTWIGCSCRGGPAKLGGGPQEKKKKSNTVSVDSTRAAVLTCPLVYIHFQQARGVVPTDRVTTVERDCLLEPRSRLGDKLLEV